MGDLLTKKESKIIRICLNIFLLITSISVVIVIYSFVWGEEFLMQLKSVYTFFVTLVFIPILSYTVFIEGVAEEIWSVKEKSSEVEVADMALTLVLI